MHLRPATPDDEAFLVEVYSKNREHEFAFAGWDEAALQQFLEMQYRMRKSAQAMQYEAPEYWVIESDASRVGALITSRTPDELKLVDIAILPDYQGRGLGGTVISELQRQAMEAGVPIVLHVDLTNPRARTLYEKMGFRVTIDLSTMPIYYPVTVW